MILTLPMAKVIKDHIPGAKVFFLGREYTRPVVEACIYADGVPVTLRFADKIGEILTASTDIKAPPLAFKYYI